MSTRRKTVKLASCIRRILELRHRSQGWWSCVFVTGTEILVFTHLHSLL